MGRADNLQQGSTSPVKMYIDWKSDDQSFAYWDKDKQENVKIGLPFTFCFLDQYHAVTGYNPDKEQGIFSNEVFDLQDQELEVSFNKTDVKPKSLIAKGLWNDIKDQIDKEKGQYCKNIYIMTQKGTLCRLSIKGAAVSSWFEFFGEAGDSVINQWVVAKDIKSGKKGNVTYTYPVFELGENLSKEDGIKADDLETEVKEWKTPSNKSERQEAIANSSKQESLPSTDESEDLPF